MKPRIGITYSDEIKVGPYAEAIRAAGGEPVLIAPESEDPGPLHGLLLGGGVDVNPALYGEARAPETEHPNDARDRIELDLLASAAQADLPVLAICRGAQLLNVSYKGSLTQHMHGHEMRTEDRGLPAHTVMLEGGSKLGLISQSESLRVNSRHHQAISRVGGGLRVSARADDGTIEAIEDPARRFVLGVQWHPEDMASEDPIQKLLFRAFITEASNHL